MENVDVAEKIHKINYMLQDAAFELDLLSTSCCDLSKEYNLVKTAAYSLQEKEDKLRKGGD